MRHQLIANLLHDTKLATVNNTQQLQTMNLGKLRLLTVYMKQFLGRHRTLYSCQIAIKYSTVLAYNNSAISLISTS